MMWRSLAFGVATGLRSQLPPAVLAWRQARHDLPEDVAGPARILRRRGAVPTLALAAVAELVTDKLARTPSRLEAGSFLGRLSLGATAGAGIAAAFRRSRVVGGFLGVAGAAVGSYAGARYRAAAHRAHRPARHPVGRRRGPGGDHAGARGDPGRPQGHRRRHRAVRPSRVTAWAGGRHEGCLSHTHDLREQRVVTRT